MRKENRYLEWLPIRIILLLVSLARLPSQVWQVHTCTKGQCFMSYNSLDIIKKFDISIEKYTQHLCNIASVILQTFNCLSMRKIMRLLPLLCWFPRSLQATPRSMYAIVFIHLNFWLTLSGWAKFTLCTMKILLTIGCDLPEGKGCCEPQARPGNCTFFFVFQRCFCLGGLNLNLCITVPDWCVESQLSAHLLRAKGQVLNPF